MGKWYAFSRPARPSVCFALIHGRRILLRPQRHRPPRTHRHIHDARPAHHVDRLVRVLRDVVCAGAVMLDEDMVERLVQCARGVLAY